VAPPARIERVPDPLAPPVAGAPLGEDQRTAAVRAVNAAERGDAAAARGFVAALPAGHPVTRLVRLECEHLGGGDVRAAARDLAAEHPGYGAAWELVVQLERKAGDLEGALDAARQLLGVRPGRESQALASEAESAVVAAARAAAEARLAAGDAPAAYAVARAGLDRVPEAATLRELAVRAALAAGQPRAAAELVAALPDEAGAMVLKARVAAALGQWGLAMELYEAAPEGTPGRCAGYLEARERWRLSNAPPYVVRALAAAEVRRRHLASILVWEAPSLAAFQAGPVAVFEDVVQLPEQRDIVTVTRAGVMLGDAVTRRFLPERTVRPAELRGTLDRLAAGLGRPAPRWCAAAGERGCLALPEVPDGTSVAALVRQVVADGEAACR